MVVEIHRVVIPDVLLLLDLLSVDEYGGLDRYREIRHMFYLLKDDYLKSMICHWRRNVYDRLMVMDQANIPMEVLCNDPHEARFLKDAELLDSKSDIMSPRFPDQGDFTGYPTFRI